MLHRHQEAHWKDNLDTHSLDRPFLKHAPLLPNHKNTVSVHTKRDTAAASIHNLFST